MNELPSIERPLNQYGTMMPIIDAIRRHNPMDLTHERWREQHPEGDYQTWQDLARACVMTGLHYDPGPVELNAETQSIEDRGDFTLERVVFNTTPWHRLSAYVLLPHDVQQPVPGLLVLHAWGGPMYFGKERIVDSGRDHEILRIHREECYDGHYLAEEFVRQGYAVICIDAHHFGSRIPSGIADIPESIDPFELSVDECHQLQRKLTSLLYHGVKELNWAGTTWAGLNFWDDARCIDYLCSRPEVDSQRIGVTGLSGGGWRTNILAALDQRIQASVSVGWMTTCAQQELYNVAGAVGTFCLLPGVWNRLDIPDLAAMSAHAACMVVIGERDILFPAEAKDAAEQSIRAAFDWAGQSHRCHVYRPDLPHCYNREVQAEAIRWFERHLQAV